MKNKLGLMMAVTILMMLAMGCSMLNPFGSSTETPANTSASDGNRTITDDAVDVTVGEEKIGIEECDAVMDFLTREANNPDDDYITKAIKRTVFNRVRDGIKKSVEENKSDPEELRKTCKEFAKNLEEFKAKDAGNSE